jgi:hypothetical protein
VLGSFSGISVERKGLLGSFQQFLMSERWSGTRGSQLRSGGMVGSFSGGSVEKKGLLGSF